jgi:hypothetical protein
MALRWVGPLCMRPKTRAKPNACHADACARVQKATGKLARHVFRKRDQLLGGISAVADVEDDLKAAFMIARTSRASLKQSGEEIMRNVRVAGQTRRKQAYMELMEVRKAHGHAKRHAHGACELLLWQAWGCQRHAHLAIAGACRGHAWAWAFACTHRHGHSPCTLFHAAWDVCMHMGYLR